MVERKEGERGGRVNERKGEETMEQTRVGVGDRRTERRGHTETETDTVSVCMHCRELSRFANMREERKPSRRGGFHDRCRIPAPTAVCA